MKTILMLVTVSLLGTGVAATAATLSKGQTDELARKSAAARAVPSCCYTKTVATRLPSGGVLIRTSQACFKGCDKPCSLAKK